MTKFFKWFFIILAILVVGFIVSFVAFSCSYSEDEPGADNYCIVNIYDGDSLFYSASVKAGDDFVFPTGLTDLTNNRGAKYIGLTGENRMFLIDSASIPVDEDIDLYVVYADIVQVNFQISEGSTTLVMAHRLIALGSTIGDLAPDLADGELWVVQFSDSGTNIGVTYTSEQIKDFVVTEHVVFCCQR